MKKIVRLTESDLHKIVENTVKRVMTENAATKRKYINRIYKLTQEYTSHKFTDDNWHYLHELVDKISDVNGIVDVNMWVEDGGYREHDGVEWKEYKLDITTEMDEVIHGTIKCYFCGTMEDPRSSYDMTLTMY